MADKTEPRVNNAQGLDPARIRLMALTVAVAFFIHNLDSTLIVTSLPQIAASFGIKPVDMSASISAYLLASAALLPMSSWLADRFGARRIFVLAITLFVLGSVGSGVARSFPLFIAGRIAQGIAGAMMVPVGRALVLRQAEGADLLNVMQLITYPGLLAPVIAPVLGGVITTYTSWRFNFLLNVPLGVAGIVAAQRLMPATDSGQRRPLDVVGTVLLTTGMASLLYSLEHFTESGGHSLTLLAQAGFGAAALWYGTRHLRRSPHPLLDLSPFAVQTFRLMTLNVGMVFRATIAVTPFLMPLLLQLGYGLTSLQGGTFLMIYFLANVSVKPLNLWLLRHAGFRSVLIWNGVLSGVATAACGFVDPVSHSIFTALVLFATGTTRSLQFSTMTFLTFADLPAAQRGAGTTLQSMVMPVASALGVAVSAAVLQKATLLHALTQPGLAEFRIAFVAIGLVGVFAAFGYFNLPRDAGASIVPRGT